MIRGACLCGAVRYQVDGALRDITHCHCSMCRRFHGAAFGTYGSVSRRRVQVEGEVARYASSANVVRSFCATCGASLFWEHSEHPRLISITLGTIADDPGERPRAHIYVASKAPWIDIADGLPQHDAEMPADEAAQHAASNNR